MRAASSIFLVEQMLRYGRSWTEPLASLVFIRKEDLHPQSHRQRVQAPSVTLRRSRALACGFLQAAPADTRKN